VFDAGSPGAYNARPLYCYIHFLEHTIMYAVIVTGGKQYRVEQGERLRVELLTADVGSTVELDQVLLVADGTQFKVGSPLVEGAKVSAEVLSHGRHKKIEILKFRRRKHHMKRMGHRQYFTELKITGISA